MKENQLLLLCVGALLVGQALSQGACTRLTGEDIGSTTSFSNRGILANVLGNLHEGVIVGSFRVDGVQIVCEAQHPMQDRFRYTSALVAYTCISSDSRLSDICDETERTVQLTLGCDQVDNTWWIPIFNHGGFALTRPPDANTSTALASNCLVCIHPTHPIAISATLSVQPETHCFGKFLPASCCTCRL